ncbi:MAG: tripartite tricarboxylate transporter substrate binding protein [Betaproteobacteria bacterium]|nr:tripartite tricarboxylate transporter substrate binding protein [Betaproteobacteria bacterium]
MRTILRAFVALMLLALPGLAVAQAFPSKPVRFIVPLTAGGLTDILMRAVALELSKIWGQPTLVENRPGASLMIGTDVVAKSPADGYTMLISDSSWVINPILYSKLPYGPNDLVPVVNMVLIPLILVANSQLPANKLNELIALARSKPGELNYGSVGIGTILHLDLEGLAFEAGGLKLTHVPYKGISEVFPALATGQIHIALAGVPPALSFLKQGRVKGIAFSGSKRSVAIPDVPTFAESGMPNFTSAPFHGLMAPAGTPRAVLDRIAADVGRVVANPEFNEKFIVGVGLESRYMGPDEFAQFINAYRDRFVARTKHLKIQLN